MRKTMLLAILFTVIGFVFGAEVPKASKTASYVVITGTTKGLKSTEESLQEAQILMQSTCKSEFLVIDRNTDIREGKKRAQQGPLTIIIRFDSKQTAVDCYESEGYQRLLQIRKPYSEWNLRITDGMR